MVFNERNLLVHLVVLCISWELRHATRQQRDCFYRYTHTTFMEKERMALKNWLDFLTFFFPFFFFFSLQLPCLMLKKLLFVSKHIVHIFLACTLGPRMEVPMIIYKWKKKTKIFQPQGKIQSLGSSGHLYGYFTASHSGRCKASSVITDITQDHQQSVISRMDSLARKCVASAITWNHWKVPNLYGKFHKTLKVIMKPYCTLKLLLYL